MKRNHYVYDEQNPDAEGEYDPMSVNTDSELDGYSFIDFPDDDACIVVLTPEGLEKLIQQYLGEND